MPIKNCILCDDLLITSEEQKYGSHYHCDNEKRMNGSHLRSIGGNENKNSLSSLLVLAIYNSFVICLFLIAMMLV